MLLHTIQFHDATATVERDSLYLYIYSRNYAISDVNKSSTRAVRLKLIIVIFQTIEENSVS